MPLHGAPLAQRIGVPADDCIAFPAGEGNKNRIEWSRLTNVLLNRGLGRDAIVVAVGGGVTGDLAGFVAATYMRGIPYVQVPTTLLAMLDASIGGKTGVDTPAGKNLVGAFHHPELVLIDPDVLGTLPQREFRAGLAEALKHALIDSHAHLELIMSSAPALVDADRRALEPVLVRSLQVKQAIVQRDEREGGLRKMLNAGHTIGHAVEAVAEYGMLHGECVAIGLVVEARIAASLGAASPDFVDRVRRAAELLGLPVAIPESMQPEAILAATATDKKARAGAVEYALLSDVGQMLNSDAGFGTAVSDEVVLDALRASMR
jgi:3-dehydroquinate synthase